MGTETVNDNLAATLFGKTRRAILALLFGHPDETYYLRQISRAAGPGLGATQRELKQLAEAGIIERRVRGGQVHFRANPRCPIFAELRGLVVKTTGVGDVLRAALASLADRINVAFIYGSMARGEERRGSDVDLLVIGELTFGEVVSALAPVQERLGREVNPTVYRPSEFRSKVRAKHHFLTAVRRGGKVFLFGDEHELARLAQERLTHGAQKQSRRD